MCLIVVALNEHPDYRLIVVANRDEAYDRDTAPANYWKDHPDVLGGRDLKACGTWLAMNVNGRISMITNYRDPGRINPNAPSRGQLVTDYVLSSDRPLRYMEHVASKGDQYNGFNLLAGSPKELYYYSNYGNGIAPVGPGLHGLSNHLLNTPWPKVKNAVQKVKSILNAKSVDPERLVEAMYDDAVAPDVELPDTGVGRELERQLSSMFIKSPGYGSRSSTAVLVGRDNHVRFVERVYNTGDFSYTTQSFDFQIR
ncbi:MAG TPA: NRDE family protein [Cyclobacteriaceae bacterium]|nr:NRDE family protein [Cyclobacteriaceae bacterium]